MPPPVRSEDTSALVEDPASEGVSHRVDDVVDAGFTLVEVMAAMVVFVLVSSAVIGTILNGVVLSRGNRDRVTAASLAAADLDLARNTDVTALASGPSLSKRTESVNAKNYVVSRQVQWVAKNATAGPCDGGTGTRLAYMRVDSSITWANMGPIAPVVSSTLIYPNVGSFSANTGNLAVKVRDASATPLANMRLTLTGTNSAQQVTANDGCALFGFLPAGSYTLSISQLGYVDYNGNASPTATVTVTTGATAGYAFDYDQAAGLRLAFQPPTGYTVPAGLRVRLGNTNLGSTGVSPAFGPATDSAVEVSSLFPFASGYTSWAGSCGDADPGLAERGPAAVAVRGTTSQATVPLGGATLTTATATGVARSTRVYAIHAAETATYGCASGEVLDLGPTDASGSARVGLPYGSWKLSTNATGTAPVASVQLTKAAPLANVRLVVQ